ETSLVFYPYSLYHGSSSLLTTFQCTTDQQAGHRVDNVHSMSVLLLFLPKGVWLSRPVYAIMREYQNDPCPQFLAPAPDPMLGDEDRVIRKEQRVAVVQRDPDDRQSQGYRRFRYVASAGYFAPIQDESFDAPNPLQQR